MVDGATLMRKYVLSYLKVITPNSKHMHFLCQKTSDLLFLSLCLQIECSSISEYSEKIIKSNHLHNGKLVSLFGRLSICQSRAEQSDDIWIRKRREESAYIPVITVTPGDISHSSDW